MGGAFPELKRAQAFVEDTLKQEELRFRSTLGRGMTLFETAVRASGPATCSTARPPLSSTTPMASRST
jgi:alanyl-tRNA synthetase